jgi:hypothetical protein
MDEVSGPVIAIALILAAVFIPTAFIPGITGRLYQQFAITIVVSVIFSAFNALTLSPALSALLLRPKKKSRGPLGFLFGAFNKGFSKRPMDTWPCADCSFGAACLLSFFSRCSWWQQDGLVVGSRWGFCPMKIRVSFTPICRSQTALR